MPIQGNDYYYNGGGGNPNAQLEGQLTSGFSNLGSALFGDPAQRQRQPLIDAQTAEANENAVRTQQQNTVGRNQIQAAGSIGQLFHNALQVTNPDGSVRSATPQEAQAQMPGLLQGALTAGANDPVHAQNMFRLLSAATGNEDLTRMGAAATGQNMNENTAFTTGRADQITATNAKNAQTQAFGVAGIGAGATRYAADANNRGSMERQTQMQGFDLAHPEATPQGIANVGALTRQTQEQGYKQAHPDALNVGAGNSVLLAPGDVRNPAAPASLSSGVLDPSQPAPTSAPASVGTLFTAPSKPFSVNQVGASALQDKLNGMPAGPEKDALVEKMIPGVGAAEARAANRPPTAVSPAVIKLIDPLIDEALAGTASLSDDAKNVVRSRASELYQTTKNPQTAVEAAVQEFLSGNPPDQGVLSNIPKIGGLFTPKYGVPPKGPAAVVPQVAAVPQGAANAPAAAPGAQPGVAPAQPATVPPGSAYSPSRGMWRSPDGRMFDATGKPLA